MTTQFNTAHLNKYLAPGISDFTSFDAPDISDAHPEAPHWLANHFLNSIFRGAYKNKYRQWAINQIYRAQTALNDYHEARNLTEEFLLRSRPGNPASRIYFRSLARWESCLLNVQIFVDVMNKMKQHLKDEPVFTASDRSAAQKAYDIANTVKHWGSDISADRHDETHTIPLWLTNGGLQTRTTSIEYTELASLISEIASVATELQDAKTFFSKGNT